MSKRPIGDASKVGPRVYASKVGPRVYASKVGPRVYASKVGPRGLLGGSQVHPWVGRKEKVFGIHIYGD
jgi:hypothetical protein